MNGYKPHFFSQQELFWHIIVYDWSLTDDDTTENMYVLVMQLL